MNEFSKTLAVGLAVTGIFMTGWLLGADYTQRRINKDLVKFTASIIESFNKPMTNYEVLPLSEDEKVEAELDEKFRATGKGVVKGEIK